MIAINSPQLEIKIRKGEWNEIQRKSGAMKKT